MNKDIKLAFTVPLGEKLCSLPFGVAVKLCKKNAFTLAETLITLTIIGVIAAMTIPTLVSNYQKQTYVTGLKKAYSQLQNAVKMMPITEGFSAGDYSSLRTVKYTDSGKEEVEILSRQFKVQKMLLGTGGNSTENFCRNLGVYACFQTDDGMIFGSSHGMVSVDVNGNKGPNKYGRDIFMFMIPALNNNAEARYTGNLGVVFPYGSKLHKQYGGSYWKDVQGACDGSNISNYQNYCAARILEEGKMDY